MSTKRLYLFLLTSIMMLFFHRCNHNDEAIRPTFKGPIYTEPLFKSVDIQEDGNLQSALNELFAGDESLRVSELVSPVFTNAIVGKDVKRNLVHYSIPIILPEKPGFQNLVVTLTPEKKVFGHIYSYVSNKPKEPFSEMKDFTGDLIIYNLEGKEVARSFLENGKTPSSENSRTSNYACVTTTYFTTVSSPYGSYTSIAYVDTNCIYYTGTYFNFTPEEIQSIGGGASGGGTGGVPVYHPYNYTSSYRPTIICPQSFSFNNVTSTWQAAAISNYRYTIVKVDVQTGQVSMNTIVFNLEVGVPRYSSLLGRNITPQEAKDAAAIAANQAERWVADNRGDDFFGAGATTKYSKIFADKMQYYLNVQLFGHYPYYNITRVTNKFVNLSSSQATQPVYRGPFGC